MDRRTDRQDIFDAHTFACFILKLAKTYAFGTYRIVRQLGLATRESLCNGTGSSE